MLHNVIQLVYWSRAEFSRQVTQLGHSGAIYALANAVFIFSANHDVVMDQPDHHLNAVDSGHQVSSIGLRSQAYFKFGESRTTKDSDLRIR